MTTIDLVQAYIAAKRAQGSKLESAQGVLCHFARETGNIPLAAAFTVVPIVIMAVYLLAARRYGAFDAL